MNSTHKVECFSIQNIQNHEGADSLEIINVFGGYPCIVRKGNYKVGDLACYVPPESVVDTNRPEFAFLGNKNVVKAKRLRGQQSFGLIVKAPGFAKEGDDLAEYFEVTHYEPVPADESKMNANNERGPSCLVYKYDLESLRRYPYIFEDGELVTITEKLSGFNSRFVFDSQKNKQFCGSRNYWKKEDDLCVWWQAFYFNPSIEKFCVAYPDHVLYGEIYGKVGGFSYGINKGGHRFAGFDIYSPTKGWLSYDEAARLAEEFSVPWAPLIAYDFPYNFNKLTEMAEGKTTVPKANHIREGIVISPKIERVDSKIGRVKMKLVSLAYLEKH